MTAAYIPDDPVLYGEMLAACRSLLLDAAADGTLQIAVPDAEDFAANFVQLLQFSAPDMLASPVSLQQPDAVLMLESMTRRYRGKSLSGLLGEAVFAALTAAGCMLDPALEEASEDREFLLRQAQYLLQFPAMLAKMLAGRHLRPAAREFLTAEAFPADRAGMLERLRGCDPLAGGRAFQYHDGRFLPITLDTIRKVDDFFGFAGVRRIFKEQFRDFAGGKAPVPLLITSLPGHGKTQLTIAHVLAHPELTLITADEAILNHSLPELIAALRLRPDRRFVVFFDDLEPDRINWYDFRTYVGGAFSPPDHVMLAMASNFDFPPSIQSRGCGVHFPTFDDVRCQEMIDDFLIRAGFRRSNQNLISLIATGYTEDFGQKKFSELSPRTLIRYLKSYQDNRQKRRDAVQLACGQVIPRPDSQLFYEFNIKLMRKLYGKEYIEEMLQERLRSMS